MKFLPRNSSKTINNRKSSKQQSTRWAFDEFKNQYELKEFMGEGCFGKVHKVRSRIRNRSSKGIFSLKQQLFACKTIQKSKLDDLNRLKEECSNLEEVRGHPHLLQFEQTFEDDNEVHIISELLEGGELYDAVIEMKKRRAYFTEEDSAWMLHGILDGISYLHDVVGIVHRDLKASNFMFKKRIETTGKKKKSSQGLREIKIIDFGLSTKIDPETGKVSGAVGTPYYVAPELLTEETYDSKCDVWSCGVIAYLVLSSRLPFQGKTEEETINFLMNAESHPPKYNSNRWMTLDPLAVDFCKSLLYVDPSKRPTAREAMSHPWIVKHCGQVPPQRPRINLEHSITVAPTEDETLLPTSQTFDSERSSLTQETHRTSSVIFEGIPDEKENEDETRMCSRSSKNHQKKSPLKRLFSSPSKSNQTISRISNKGGKPLRTRQKTENTLVLEE